MALKTFNPITPSLRELVIVDRSELHKGKPVKALTRGLTKNGGRNNTGRICIFTQGGGHGGSHPHLVHEFVTALVEGRDPYPNAVQSANWTCVGILAHQSALKGGEIIKLPKFTLV